MRSHEGQRTCQPGWRWDAPARWLPSGLLLAGALLTAAAPAAETRHYDWLTSGRATGALVLAIADDGTRRTRFSYEDRGRGPKLEETVRFDVQGRVSSLRISGRAYLGAPVDENFERAGNAARWRNTLEHGNADDAGEAVYLVADGSPEQTAILARALLEAPASHRTVLPVGEASIATIDRLEVGPADDRRRATLYAISGLDLAPTWVWLDEARELLAFNGGGFGLVPRGWAAQLPLLAERQQRAERDHATALAATLTRSLPREYAVEDVDLVDVRAGKVRRNRVVVVRDGRIVHIGRRLPAGFGGESLDGSRQWLVPGLWDAHVHLGLNDGMQHLAAGVTTVRDLGNNPDDLFQLREVFESGSVIGPAVIAAGVVDGRSPYSAPIGRLPESEAEALALVREYAGMGYAQVKLYSSADPAWVPAIAAETHRLGMRLSGHIPYGMNAEQAVRGGYDEIQHLNMLFLNFLAGPGVDTRTPERFTLVADHAAEVDQDGAAVQAFLALLAERGTVVDPTVAIFEDLFTQAPGQPPPSLAPVVGQFPPALRRQLLAARLNQDAGQAEARRDDFQALLEMVGRLYRRGVRLVPGTDAMPGFTLHRELELYVQAGIPPAEVLHMATLGAAEVMGVAGEVGTLEEGKRADFVLLGANPLEDISAVRTARLVVRGQHAFEPRRLYAAMGIDSGK